MSDTPRTDAASYVATDYDTVVDVSVARTLERELATATRERDEAREALRKIANGDLYNADGMRTIARNALAATETKP